MACIYSVHGQKLMVLLCCCVCLRPLYFECRGSFVWHAATFGRMSETVNTNVIIHSHHKHKFKRATHITSAETLLVILFRVNSWITDKKDSTCSVMGSKNNTGPTGFVAPSLESVYTHTKKMLSWPFHREHEVTVKHAESFFFFIRGSKYRGKECCIIYCLSFCLFISFPITERPYL